MSNFPTIPEFTNNPSDIAASLRAIKQVVEILAGLRQGEAKGAPQMYVQKTEPNPALRISYKVGDFWINDSTSPPVLYYWTGAAWQAIA